MPEALHAIVWKEIEKKIARVRYARVMMPLLALLERDFFNTYIKRGDCFPLPFLFCRTFFAASCCFSL